MVTFEPKHSSPENATQYVIELAQMTSSGEDNPNAQYTNYHLAQHPAAVAKIETETTDVISYEAPQHQTELSESSEQNDHHHNMSASVVQFNQTEETIEPDVQDDNFSEQICEEDEEEKYEAEEGVDGTVGENSRLLERKGSKASVGRELRRARENIARQIENEMHINLDQFDLEDLLDERQKRRDSLDEHLYHLACVPELADVTPSYACEDVPTLEEVTSVYFQREPVIDDKLVTSYKACLNPERLQIPSSYQKSAPVRLEVDTTLAQEMPLRLEVESSLLVGDMEREQVESCYQKNEVSYLKSIENIFSHNSSVYKDIPSQFHKSECSYQANYVTEFRHNQCRVSLAPKTFEAHPSAMIKTRNTYAKFDGFDGVSFRSSSFCNGVPRFKDRPVSWGFHYNTPLLSRSTSSFARAEPTMKASMTSSFKENLGLIMQHPFDVECTNAGKISRAVEPMFLFNSASFTDEDDVRVMRVHMNAVKREETPIFLINEGVKLVDVEVECECNDPVLQENEDA